MEICRLYFPWFHFFPICSIFHFPFSIIPISVLSPYHVLFALHPMSNSIGQIFFRLLCIPFLALPQQSGREISKNQNSCMHTNTLIKLNFISMTLWQWQIYRYICTLIEMGDVYCLNKYERYLSLSILKIYLSSQHMWVKKINFRICKL